MDPKLLKECPVLSEEEKELLNRIDVKGETLTSVARSLGKAKSTISSQRTKAKEKFERWLNERTVKIGKKTADIDSYVFSQLLNGVSRQKITAKVGHAEIVAELVKLFEQNDYEKTTDLLKENEMYYADVDKPLFYSVNYLIHAARENENRKRKLIAIAGIFFNSDLLSIDEAANLAGVTEEKEVVKIRLSKFHDVEEVLKRIARW